MSGWEFASALDCPVSLGSNKPLLHRRVVDDPGPGCTIKEPYQAFMVLNNQSLIDLPPDSFCHDMDLNVVWPASQGRTKVMCKTLTGSLTLIGSSRDHVVDAVQEQHHGQHHELVRHEHDGHKS